jgi:hypothetical protein
LVQASLTWQECPQMPQLAASYSNCTHWSPHRTEPDGQTQAPPLQIDPPPQVAPQLPQLSGSLRRSTQAPLHAERPVVHEAAQRPELHTWAAEHCLPQAPQLAVLLWVSTQALPHAIWAP